MDALEYSAGAFPRCLMAITIYKGRNEIVAHPLKLDRSEHRWFDFFPFLFAEFQYKSVIASSYGSLISDDGTRV